MMRTIEISTEVFAAIWRNRRDGEETESQILERLFGCQITDSFQKLTLGDDKRVSIDGYYDNRNNVHFPEGFCVFRSYKGKVYRAIATNGQWLRLDDNSLFTSLNKLNESIAAGNENIWNGNWQYLDENQERFSIDNLR